MLYVNAPHAARPPLSEVNVRASVGYMKGDFVVWRVNVLSHSQSEPEGHLARERLNHWLTVGPLPADLSVSCGAPSRVASGSLSG